MSNFLKAKWNEAQAKSAEAKHESNLAKADKGSLLIESLLGVVILSIGLMVVIQAFLTSVHATTYAVDYSTAALLGENKISELKQKGFIKDGFEEENFFSEPFEKFQYRVKSSNIKDGSEDGPLNLVEVLLSWTSGHKSNQLSVSTYLLNLKNEEKK